MEDGGEVMADCPQCLDEAIHEVVKKARRGKGEDCLVKCLECGVFHTLLLRPPRAVMVKASLSHGSESFAIELEVDDDEKIAVGDVFEHDDRTWEVTRVDDANSRSEEIMLASEIGAIWAKRTDKTIIAITMNDGEVSDSTKMECDPDRRFSCGSIIQIDGRKWRIRGLHTGQGRTLTGSRTAREIRRIYLQLPKSSSSVRPRKK